MLSNERMTHQCEMPKIINSETTSFSSTHHRKHPDVLESIETPHSKPPYKKIFVIQKKDEKEDMENRR